MEIYNQATHYLLTFTMVVLALAVFACLVRALLGPRFTDRIIAINLIGTKTIILICALALYLGEQYLADVALIYALISFLAVVVLVNIYLSSHKRKQAKLEEMLEEAEEEKQEREEAK